MAVETKKIRDVVIRFAGDSGDGIQLIGTEFTKTTGLAQNDLGTFPDFPAEIRAPVGTLAGVSGYQIHFGSKEIHTPGDDCDMLVVMNAAALKKNLGNLKKGGIIVANEDGFDSRNLRLAGYPDGAEPLEDPRLSQFTLYKVPITKLTREALRDLHLGTKEADRSKNMFALGLVYWMYHRSMQPTVDFIEKKFAKSPAIKEANLRALHYGYSYGETTELFADRFEVLPASLPPGIYRGITGNVATAYGLIAATKKAGLSIFYGSYPITPASDILHELARHKNFDVLTFQAEDEIAAICSALGASYGGRLGVTASSGPGIDLKTEALGLAVMLELPLVLIDVQRAGPSTGMPTKTEQADLLQAFFGRHGEAPLPIVAAKSPADCFTMVYEACRIAIEHMTPVFFLSDGYIANGSEPWKFPAAKDLPVIQPKWATLEDGNEDRFMPYRRDENLVRKWAVPGIPGLQNRIGGIEKEDPTGNISYDALNHERMVHTRADKVARIADSIPLLEMDNGDASGKMLILGWGSTYGTIKTAVIELRSEGYDVSHAHLTYLNPFPKNLGEILKGFEKVLIPEMNTGQLLLLIRSRFLVPALGINKIQGMPFTVAEIRTGIIAAFEGEKK
ncbi:MAG: 2-oxoacid:acceptor oxidoreductase subunit alpha [Bacteroidota bacterium]|nr:2-oxoacid:acceptor oxidoreductase subunit alpha [Bacteroidota bacterium]